MAVRIWLDRPNAHFTNLDYITGRVALDLPSRDTISSVTVKLEGESSSVIRSPNGNENNYVEFHKVLYRIQTVFPTPDLVLSGNSAFPLGKGHYEYPFSFKIPFNNDCERNARGIQVLLPARHVRKTLPPSLDYDGVAGVRYYVKATIARPSLLKQNFRESVNFLFLPIEPPRSPDTHQEAFARRQQAFSRPISQFPLKPPFFRSLSTASRSLDTGCPPSSYTIELRLPNPPILTCGGNLPLRIILNRLNSTSEILFLDSLQIELISYTGIRAEAVSRVDTGSFVLFSKAAISLPLGGSSHMPVSSHDDFEKTTGNTSNANQIVIDDTLWRNIRLPSTVAPSFITCNITRTYVLEVRVGISRGLVNGRKELDSIISPLRIEVQVYSGIAPPPELLAAISPNGPPLPSRPGAGSTLAPPQQSVQPITPIEPPYDDAPPSYEEAMAENVSSVAAAGWNWREERHTEEHRAGFGVGGSIANKNGG